MKTEITTVSNWHTLLCKNDKQQKIAALLFPSSMETAHSYSKCSVDFNSGTLNINKPKKLTDTEDSITSFITDATAMEMDDCMFRLACLKNYVYLNRLTFNINDKTTANSFVKSIKDWIHCLPYDYTMCRLFGGDIIKTEMLECLFNAFACTNKTFYISTSRIDILNDIYKKNIIIPSNVYVYSRSHINCDIIPMHNFHKIDISSTSKGDLDLNTYPDGKSDISIRLGDDNDTKLRTKQPWFQL